MTADLGIETVSTTDVPKAAGPKPVAEPKVKEAAKTSASEALASDETTDESETSDTSTDDESLEGDETESEKSGDESKPKKKSGTQKRIDKLTKRVSEREREIEYWKAEAVKAKTPAQEQKAQANVEKLEAKPAIQDGRPNAETWEGTHADYIEALTDWKLDQAEKMRTAKAEESKQAEKLQVTLKSHAERVEKFKSEHADFDETLEDVDDVPMSRALQVALVESDFGPEIMYELAKNRAEYERIAKLDVRQIERVIGRMEAKFESAKSPATDEEPTEEIKKSKAPPPINPVSAKSKVSLKKSADDMDADEYMEWRKNKNRR